MQQPTFTMARTKEGVRIALPNYVENAFELLDETGEWYLDRPARKIYYKPRPGEDLTKLQVVFPALETLVEMRGSIERPVRNVTFRNLTFADATWLQPSRIGHADVQANFLNDHARPLSRDGVVTTIHNEQLESPANVVCRHAEGVTFDGCTFTRLGGAGLDIEKGSRVCQVAVRSIRGSLGDMVRGCRQMGGSEKKEGDENRHQQSGHCISLSSTGIHRNWKPYSFVARMRTCSRTGFPASSDTSLLPCHVTILAR